MQALDRKAIGARNSSLRLMENTGLRLFEESDGSARMKEKRSQSLPEKQQRRRWFCRGAASEKAGAAVTVCLSRTSELSWDAKASLTA
jgi:hypothetical protein